MLGDVFFAVESGPWLALLIGISSAVLILFVGRLVVIGRDSAALLELLAEEARIHESNQSDGEAIKQRRCRRWRGRLVEVLVSDDRNQEASSRGFVVDRSNGGLGLALPGKISKGQILKVRAVQAPQSTPWVRVQVMHSRRLGREHSRLGCKYLGQPPWGVRLLFG